MNNEQQNTALQNMMIALGQRAKIAARGIAIASTETKNKALYNVASLLRERVKDILDANAIDVENARASNMDAPRLDRLTLTPKLIENMALACEEVASQPDPVGAMDTQWQRPNGLLIGKMRIPLGVVCMIYESRPNVTIDAAILCLKAGNAVILRGGSEAFHSNILLAKILSEALKAVGLPQDSAQIVNVTEHSAVGMLCKMDSYIDVMIPRGGENLIRRVCAEATMPVLKHFKGVCHMFIDASADANMAIKLAINGKTQRPGVCNALECILIHKDCASTILPALGKALNEKGVAFRACPQSLPLLGEGAVPASENDWGYEFHDLILAVRVVSGMDEALEHIAKYGSNHTEVICTNNHTNAMRFVREADASMVAVNASTRFNDGGQLGLGAEIGICTSKLHSYGAMGAKELTTTKFVTFGNGQVRE